MGDDLGEGWESALRALHGDLRPLIALLRSDRPIGRAVRDYVADELEHPAGNRFVQRHKTDLESVDRDLKRCLAMSTAKLELAKERFPDSPLNYVREISDKDAFDHLVKTGRAALDAQVEFKNAKRRLPKHRRG